MDERLTTYRLTSDLPLTTYCLQLPTCHVRAITSGLLLTCDSPITIRSPTTNHAYKWLPTYCLPEQVQWMSGSLSSTPLTVDGPKWHW